MTRETPLNTSPLPMRLRVEDFMLLDDGGAFRTYGKTELIGGEIYFMNAQHRPHMFVKSELAFRLRLSLEALGSDLFVGVEGSARMSDHDLPEPDILVTDDARGSGPVPGGSVALIVEVADASLDFDSGRKARLYASTAVPEYWIAVINARMIHQHWMPREGVYTESRSVAFGEPIAAATIGGLVVPTVTL